MYMSDAMREWIASPEYKLRQYQKPEAEIKENIFEDFMDFVEDQYPDMPESDLSDLRALIQDFLGYDEKIVAQAEQARLTAWKQSVQQGEK